MSEDNTVYDTIKIRGKDLYRISEAIDKIAPLIGSRIEAKNDIIDRAIDGKLTLYALNRWTTKKPFADKFSHTKPKHRKNYKTPVPNEVLSDTKDIQKLFQYWDWEKGHFWFPRFDEHGNFKYRIKISFVRVRKHDIDCIVDELERALKNRGQSGRPVDEIRWGQFTYVLTKFASEYQDFHSYLSNQEAFKAAFQSYYENIVPNKASRLSKSAFAKRLDAVCAHYRDARVAASTHKA